MSTSEPNIMTLLQGKDGGVFRSVLEYVKNPYDFRRLGQTCQAFHEYFGNPNNDIPVWNYIFKDMIEEDYPKNGDDDGGPHVSGEVARGVDYRLVHAQHKVFVKFIAKRIEVEQKSGLNILLEEFGKSDRFENGMKSFLQECVIKFIEDNLALNNPGQLPDGHADLQFGQWSFRHDTTEYFADLIQANMVSFIEKSLKVSLHRSSSNADCKSCIKEGKAFPALEEQDLRLVVDISNSWGLGMLSPRSFRFGDSRTTEAWMEEQVPIVNSIVRRLAFQGGVHKLSNRAFSYIWCIMLQMTSLLLRFAAMEHRHWLDCPAGNKSRPRLTHPAHLHISKFPPAYVDGGPCMPAPKQLDDAAKYYELFVKTTLSATNNIEIFNRDDESEYAQLYQTYWNLLDEKEKAQLREHEEKGRDLCEKLDTEDLIVPYDNGAVLEGEDFHEEESIEDESDDEFSVVDGTGEEESNDSDEFSVFDDTDDELVYDTDDELEGDTNDDGDQDNNNDEE